MEYGGRWIWKGGIVDQVALIVAALEAGLAVPRDAPDALAGAYGRLRETVCRRLMGHAEGELALARYEADPKAGRELLIAVLAQAGAGNDVDLAAAAAAVMEVLNGTGKYAVDASEATGVQVGDSNTQNTYIVGQYVDRRGSARPTGYALAGRLLSEITDPFSLEVHRAADYPQPGLPQLPAYVPREHDGELAEVARAAASGSSRIAVLVGGSSTGKTRACWEALRLLRERPEPWRLWHPIDPSRPGAVLRELSSIGSRTVVWLNDAQFYLDAIGGAGERVAAGLRELLRDPDRTPILILATLWPQYWAALTARPLAGDDPHAQARELIAGQDIKVPIAFTPEQLQDAAAAGDPRLAAAVLASEDGQVIQFLAGVPELMARFRHAPPPAAALIDAAIDARRLGMGVALPLAFLKAAAPGYLTDAEWNELTEDWLEQALTYTAAPCQGIRGPLARIRPRPGRDSAPVAGTAYQLADYLEQHGRRARRDQMPPEDFWAVAARYAAPAELPALANSAEARGLLRDAARLRKHAAAQGDASEAADLVLKWYSVHSRSADRRPAQWAAMHAALEEPYAVARLLDVLQEAGLREQAIRLAARVAAHMALADPYAAAWLLDVLREAGAQEQAAVLAARAAEQVALDVPDAVGRLLRALRRASAQEQAAALLARDPPSQVALDDLDAVGRLLDVLGRAGAQEQAAGLAARAAEQVNLDDPDSVSRLLDTLREAGMQEQAIVLATRAAAFVALDDADAIAPLLNVLREAGAQEQAAALAARAVAHVAVDNSDAVARLLDALREAGMEEQAIGLAARAAEQAALDDPDAVGRLLNVLREAGAQEHATVLLTRGPAARAIVHDPYAVARLLEALREAGAQDQAATLAARAAAHAAVDNPYAVARLLGVLREAGAQEHAATLAARAAAHAALDDPYAVARLLGVLREAGAQEHAAILAARAAAHAALDDPYAVAHLLLSLRNADVHELPARAAAYVALDDPDAVGRLLGVLREAGAQEQASALAVRAAGHVALDDPYAVDRLLGILREAGAQKQATGLAARATAHAALDNPYALAQLLDVLREAGAQDQAALLAARAAAHATLDNPDAVDHLLHTLREGGAADQTETLIGRLPAEGQFALYCEKVDDRVRYRFGRELDGKPAPPWSWDDLD